MRPFEGIKIIDCTHVLAGPFAAYQLAVLGADVIKVDDPNEPDQSRESGADHALNKAMMGTGFLTQGSNKRAIALNLKTEGGREALADPHLESRRVLHRHEEVPGVGAPITVPLAAFTFAHDGPSIERPPAGVGEHTDEVLKAIGYDAQQIAALRTSGAIG